MKSILNAVSLLRPLRFLFAALIGAMLFLSSMGPVQAAHNPQSKPTDGPTQLNKIMDNAEDVAHSAPMSLKETQQRANEGLNEVQGGADYEKFKSSDSKLPIVEDLEKAMDKGKKSLDR